MENKDNNENYKKMADFFYEIGTMRKIMRIHRQALLTDDMSDSIAAHSYRVTVIGWFLAKEAGADPYKTVMMCLFHDTEEARSNDHNWIHKRYVKIFDEEIRESQLGQLPYPELSEFIKEYEERESLEAILAKEADTLDQILLLREYEWSGNKEVYLWLYGKEENKAKIQLDKLKTGVGKKMGEAIYEANPSDWWNKLWTSENRKD